MSAPPNRKPKSRLSQAGPGFQYAFASLLSLVAIVATARLIPPEFGANYGFLLLAPILTGLVAGFRPALLAALLCTVSSIGFGLRPREPHPADALHFVGYLGIEALVLLGFWETHQRKRLQTDLLREQESLQLALESSNAYSWRWDIATGIVSRSIRALDHVAQPNAVRESLEAALARIHPDDRQRMREALEHAAAGHGDLDQIFRVPLADGKLRWANARGRVLRDEAGVPWRLIGITLDVTEQLRARETAETLLRRTQQLELTGEAALVGSFEWDLRTGERTQSPELPRVYGLDPGKVIDVQGWAQYLMPADRDRVLQGAARTMQDGEAFDQTYRIVDPQGVERVLRTIARAVLDAEGKPARIVGVSADLTDQVHAHEAAKQLVSLVAATDDAVIGEDLEGTIHSWNPGAERLFGYSAAEAIGRNIDILIPPGAENEPLKRLTRGERVVQHVVDRLTKDGRRVVVSLTLSPILDEAGRITGAANISRDITVLRNNEQRFRALVENSADGIALLDRSGVVLYISSSAERLSGFKPDEVVGKNVLGFTSLKDRPAVQAAFERALRQPEKPVIVEAAATVKNGLKTFRLTMTNRFADPVVKAMVFNFADITREKQAEETLRTTEKLAAMGRLAATIAHEINNPLESVSNVLYLLERQDELSESSKKYVAIATEELRRIAHIVKQTLGFYRESESAIVVSLADVVENVREMLVRRFRETVALDIRVDSRGDVVGFPGELRQVISNLLVNAMESIPDDGSVRVHVAERRNWQTGELGVRVVIADSGAGISPEARRHIFEPFFTTKGERGTGLGLWVSQGIVGKHQGVLRLRSSVQAQRHGTVFSLWFPHAHKHPSDHALAERVPQHV